jgi:hypothetical protein
MPINLEDNELLLRCACGDRTEHVAWLIHEPDDSRGNNLKGEHDDWYLHVALDPRRNIWERLWLAIKYVWQPWKTYYIGYAEIVLKNEDIDALMEFVVARRLPSALEDAGSNLRNDT